MTFDPAHNKDKALAKSIERDIEESLGFLKPEEKKIRNRLIPFLQEQILDDEDNQVKTRLEKFLLTVYSKATKDKDVAAMRLLWSYADGLPRQEIVLNDENKPRFVIGKVEINKDKKEESIVDGEVVK